MTGGGGEEEFASKGLIDTPAPKTMTLDQPVEVTEDRTPSSKTYMTGWASDGSPQYSTLFYQNNILYSDPATGKLEDIDPTLVPSEHGWTMEKAPYHVSIKDVFGDDFLTFTNGEQQLSFSIPSRTRAELAAPVIETLTTTPMQTEEVGTTTAPTMPLSVGTQDAAITTPDEAPAEIAPETATTSILNPPDDAATTTVAETVPNTSEQPTPSPQFSTGAVAIENATQGSLKDNEVTWVNVLGKGIDLDVLVDTDKVVKNAVISSLAALGDLSGKTDYEIPFTLTSNHEVSVVIDGETLALGKPIVSSSTVSIIDQKTNAVTYIWPPIAQDSSDHSNLSRTERIPVRYELQSDGSVLLTKLIPVTWLTQATFPVKADLTLSLYTGLGDGWESQGSSSWSTAHDATTGLNATYTTIDTEVRADKFDGTGSTYSINRTWLPIDTSSIGASATISSASLNLCGETVTNVNNALDINIVEGTQAATSSLATSDYPNIGTTKWSADISGSSLSTGAYNSIALNATGINAINLSGWTKFAVREKNDTENVAPSTDHAGFEFYTSDQLGTSQDPYLQVNYTLPSTAATTSYAARFDNGDFRNYAYSVATDSTSSSSHWVAQDKYGTTYTFGSATSSRLDNPDDSTQVYRWMLSEIRDTNGNYIKYNYNKDNGQVYPSSIVYTGNGSTDGPFQVNFLRTSRSDVATSSKTGFNVVDKYLVNEVNATVSGTWVHKYALNYGTGSNGRRSLITSVTESGQQEDGSVSLSLPAQTFAYTASTSGWTTTSWNLPSGSNGNFVNGTADNGARLVDVNRDGLPDITYYKQDGITNPHGMFYGHATSGAGWDSSSSSDHLPLPIITGTPLVENGIRWADINGDGWIDLLQGTDVYFNDGSANIFDPSASSTWTLPRATSDGAGADNGSRFVDLNGDGLTDLVGDYADAWFNTGKGWDHTSTSWNLPFNVVTGIKLDAGALALPM